MSSQGRYARLPGVWFADRFAGTPARHRMLLGSFGLLFVAIMLSNRNQVSDELGYTQFAHHLAHGYYTHSAHPSLWWGPGLPLLLAPLALVHTPLELMRLVGPLLLTATLILFYETLRMFVGPRTAFVGAFALGAYLPFYPLLPSLHSEILATFLIVAYMYFLTRYVREGRLPFLVVSALSLSWLAVTRVQFGWITTLVLLALLAAFVIRRSPSTKRIVVVHLLGLAACLPWLGYTYSISNTALYWGSSGGLSLYWMASTNPLQLGDWHSPETVARTRELAPDRAELASLRGLNELEADRKLRHDAVRLIKSHPINYAKHVAYNVSRLWFSYPFTATPQKLSTLFYALPNAILLMTLVLAAGILWTARSGLPRETLPFVLLIVVGVAFQALLAAYTRMIVPLVPLMLWLIAVASRHVRFEITSARLDQPTMREMAHFSTRG
jgi:hypothetical protein